MALLALTDLSLVDRGRHLGDPEPARQHRDQELGRLVLRLFQPHHPGHLRAHRAEAERGVGDVLTGQHRDGLGEHPGAQAADQVLGLLAAQLAGASTRSISAGLYWPSASVVTM